MKTKLSIIQIIGISLIPIAMIIFHLTPQTRESFEGTAMINYLIAILFFILSFGDKPKGATIFRPKIPKINWHIMLSLMYISCFTLNKDIHVFALTPIWLQVLLIFVISSFILVSFKDRLPLYIGKAASFILGIGLLTFLYYTIELLPYFPIAIVGLILLGISIHLLIPLILTIVTISCTTSKKYKNVYPRLFLSGIIAGAIIVISYSGLFHYHTQTINNAQRELVLNEGNVLPEWVTYAQNCFSPFWTKRIIGRDLIYEEYEEDWWGFNFNKGSFSEIKQNDPLVVIASIFTDKIPLSDHEQVNVLSASANTRHYAYEKLWSGRDLKVSKELTDARIYPEYRMAYFEKTIWIENTNKWEGNQQEALFTFYIPEGATATSLSLWIDGKEEKSRLTTRKKAANAYKTIVGRERRDPVVLHWQEGNRLTATIFPCTPKEARRVKIGITMPLQKQKNNLVFSGMKIQGPDNRSANELVHIKIIGNSTGAVLPGNFTEELPNQYIYDGKKLGEWTCKLKSEPLAKEPFTFNNQSWCLKPISYKTGKRPQIIYLDINNSWNIKDVKLILLKAMDIPVFAYDNGFIQINIDNIEPLSKHLVKKSFSLFPVYKIDQPDRCLLITKGKNNSPIPSELKNSAFIDSLVDYIKVLHKPIATLVIDNMKSPYITSLNQYKITDTRNISLRELKTQDIENWFKDYNQVKDEINIPTSDMAIVPIDKERNSTTTKKAPSHLLRLYNYHKVMQKAGGLFLVEDAFIPDEIYNLCNEAFIVTPVSSLIVLETQQDFERFGIEKNQNSLKNANLQDSGAVPEPGEWAMIIILGLIISVIYFKFR